MSDDVIIRAENIGKRYTLNHQGSSGGYRKFSDTLIHAAKAPLRWLHPASFTPQPSQEDFWALKDINFEVKRGEVLGIIGRNGAGKSTLLKILSRITEPTTGRITLNGRVASLLEVGTGFHPELTGRENIYLNGAILGMHRAEIKAKFDEIVAFAEVEKFLDTPVKRYSSGMYVRLAFAVAAHLEPEILIVDEVLAVGDTEFQKKCLGKMERVAQGGRTVLFVSHNFGAVRSLCTNACVLERGSLSYSGKVSDALSYYLANSNTTKDLASSKFIGPIAPQFELRSVSINETPIFGPQFTLVDSSEFKLELTYAFRTQSKLKIGVAFFVDGTRLFTLMDPSSSASVPAGVLQKSTFKLPAWLLKKGSYQIGLGAIESDFPENWLWNESLLGLQILSNSADSDQHEHGLLHIDCQRFKTYFPTIP